MDNNSTDDHLSESRCSHMRVDKLSWASYSPTVNINWAHLPSLNIDTYFEVSIASFSLIMKLQLYFRWYKLLIKHFQLSKVAKICNNRVAMVNKIVGAW